MAGARGLVGAVTTSQSRPGDQPVAVTVGGLRFRYPGAEADALTGVELSVAAGERVAVLGPNGAGKTTLMLHLNGILTPAAGEVMIDGRLLTPAVLADVRRTVGVVFQDSDDQLFMPTVGDDVGFGPANLGWSQERTRWAVMEALWSVGAEALRDRSPHQLSGGEKRRVALAGVLVMQPGLLVLDEPTAGLDPRGRRDLAALLRQLTPTQLVATHDLPFALETCDRTVIMHAGQIVADGPTRTLLADQALLAEYQLELPYGMRLDA
jgi:cobalt/nickel transport system ATP-binding protein